MTRPVMDRIIFVDRFNGKALGVEQSNDFSLNEDFSEYL
jgi:hypothetical protein